MVFLNPVMLFGVLGIGVPIILHLIRAQNAPRLEWAATKFLKASIAQSRPRFRLENALLLVLRCLLVALLALAMARPAIISSHPASDPAVADELAATNLFLPAEKQLHVLLVDGDAPLQDARGATFFLRHALQPVPAAELDRYFIKTTTVTPAQLSSVKLNDFDVIALADVSEFSGGTTGALQQYVSHGGALVIFLGPNVNRRFYNNQLFRRHALLPAELGEPHGGSGQPDNFFKLQSAPYDHPIVSLWNDPASGDLTSARFYHAFSLEPFSGRTEEPQNRPQAVLRFEDGSPAMMAGRFGSGYVILFASTANTVWNDLPTRPAFIPLIRRTVAVISQRQGGSQKPASQPSAKIHRENISRELSVPFAVAALLTAITEIVLAQQFSRSTALHRAPLRRHCFLSLRSLTLICLLPLLLPSSIKLTSKERVTPRLDLLIDTSASMTVRELGKTRIDRVKSLLKDPSLNLLSVLTSDHNVVSHIFGQHLSQLSQDRGYGWIDRLEAKSPSTAIGDSVEELLEHERGQMTAGIILFTDGQNNSGAPLREAAALAGRQNVPLYICGVGSAAPRDVMIADVSAPEMAFVHDDVPVVVRLRSTGVEDRTAKLTLKIGDEIEDQAVVTFGTNSEDIASLVFSPKTAGTFDLRASIEPFPDEATEENNQRSKRIDVTDRKINVLLVDGLPRWSFRSWQSVLAGDPHVELNCLLLDGESDFASDGHSVFLSQFPTELSAYDLIVFGDVNPKEFTALQLDAMGRFVSESGGGFVMIAGQHYSPRAYQGTPIEKLLPIELDARQADTTAADERITFTDEARSGSLLRIPDALFANTALSLPQWSAAGKAVKPAARVLVTSGNAPLLVVQQYGQGRTLYIATDELWRWVKDLGEERYAAFLEQMTQSMSLPRLSRRTPPSTNDSTSTREFEDISMDEPSLREMARLSGGEFFHENELRNLAQVIHTHSDNAQSSRKIAFWSSPLYFILLMSLLTTEWTLRRLNHLK